MNNTICLQTHAMSYHTGGRSLIQPTSLTLYSNELTVIIGPNGAGKSTLLRLLTGYLPPSAGKCLFLNRAFTQWSAKALAQHRVVMTQQTALYFPFRAAQVIAMGCAPYPKSQHKELLHKSMALTDTQCLADLPYITLSGGEQQRVQFARAIAQLGLTSTQPSYLFLDEPTSALDLGHQQKILRLLRQLITERQLGVCCILHDLNLAALYADRIIVLHKGNCVATGTVTEVFTSPEMAQWYQAELNIQPHPNYHALPHVYLHR